MIFLKKLCGRFMHRGNIIGAIFLKNGHSSSSIGDAHKLVEEVYQSQQNQLGVLH
jgi:hypothetical protein